jgi:hypothetical protein
MARFSCLVPGQWLCSAGKMSLERIRNDQGLCWTPLQGHRSQVGTQFLHIFLQQCGICQVRAFLGRIFCCIYSSKNGILKKSTSYFAKHQPLLISQLLLRHIIGAKLQKLVFFSSPTFQNNLVLLFSVVLVGGIEFSLWKSPLVIE